MGPPERDIEWSEEGVRGAWRFLSRLWALVTEQIPAIKDIKGAVEPGELDKAGEELWKKLHATIKKVTEEFEGRLGLNTAIAALMELTGIFSDYLNREKRDPRLVREVVRNLILLISPFTPFLAEELWSRLGEGKSVLETPWPQCDERALAAGEVEIPVQINGKVRARLRLPSSVAEDKQALQEAALADPAVAARISGKEVVRVIAVPGKLVSIVVG
ncbi:class I tRNA ligase family protein [Candidatus Bipolaricaulota bacterium]|nr:class I tRNA ligase family protein [Candidatus Bipolaricaulota bacterium]